MTTKYRCEWHRVLRKLNTWKPTWLGTISLSYHTEYFAISSFRLLGPLLRRTYARRTMSFDLISEGHLKRHEGPENPILGELRAPSVDS